MDFHKVILGLIDATPKLSGVEMKMLLQDRYETYYGIYDHDADVGHRPFALVAATPSEDLSKLDPFYRKAKLFSDRDVGKYFNISFFEFLMLPHHRTLELLEISTDRQKQDTKIADDLKNKLNDVVSGN